MLEQSLSLREGVGAELSEHLEADRAEQHRPEQDGSADHGGVDVDPEAVAYSRQVGPERSRDRHGRRPVDDVSDPDPLGDEGDEGEDHPRPRFRGPLARRLVPRHRAAVEQRVPRGLADRPLAHGDADRDHLGVPRGPGQLGEPRVDDVAELGVRVDDEQRQQLVAASTYRYTADDTIPRSRVTARSDRAAAPYSARCRRPISSTRWSRRLGGALGLLRSRAQSGTDSSTALDFRATRRILDSSESSALRFDRGDRHAQSPPPPPATSRPPAATSPS